MPSNTGGAGGGAPLGNRVPFGSGNRNAGNPALRQKFSGSILRFLNAASTNGCRIQYGSRFTSCTLKYGPEDTVSFRLEAVLPIVLRMPARSFLRASKRSLTVRSCSRTWLRFGLSLTRFSTCAEKVEQFLAHTELDGLMMIFPDYVEGLKMFGSEILPRLQAVPA